MVLKKLSNYTTEFKSNFKIAYPVIFGMLGHAFVGFIDNIMVGKVGVTELAAVALGNSAVFIAMSFAIGFSTALTPLIAKADGEKNNKEAKAYLKHGIVLNVILSLIGETKCKKNRGHKPQYLVGKISIKPRQFNRGFLVC